MSVESPPAAAQALLQRLWADCARSVLKDVAVFPVTVEAEADDAAGEETPAQDGKPEVWARFAAGKGLHGECALVTAEPGAVQLAQVLMSEPVDAAAEYDEGRREAYAELLRQIGGLVASGLKAVAGKEVAFTLEGNDAPSWPVAARAGVRISGEKLAAVRLTVVVSVEMAEAIASLSAPRSKEAAEPAAAVPEASAPEAVTALVVPAPNLDLLLDVRLSATIRFGQRRMLLREVMEIHPGAAVELDRHVQDPVELLVGGRLIARGEVVIADGNYGLRITEIVSPQQRIASLGKSA